MNNVVEQYMRDSVGIFSEENCKKLEDAIALIKNSNKLFFAGNGGSHSVCLHMAEDFLKVGNKRALTLENPALISCLENDYDHSDVWVEWLKRWWDTNDLLIAISSSGTSKNILKACNYIRTERGGKIITLCGNCNNLQIPALSIAGDINFFLPTLSYGAAEIYHSLWLHVILDSYVEDLNGCQTKVN